jgi:hypothetical protein
MSALRTGRLYPPGRIPGTHFCQRLSRPQGHNATGRIKSLKISSDPIGNRNPNLPACSAVPQPTAPPRTAKMHWYKGNLTPLRPNPLSRYDQLQCNLTVTKYLQQCSKDFSFRRPYFDSGAVHVGFVVEDVTQADFPRVIRHLISLHQFSTLIFIWTVYKPHTDSVDK